MMLGRSICGALLLAAMLLPTHASAQSTFPPSGIYVRVLMDESGGEFDGCPIGTETRRLGRPVNTCPEGRQSDAICISGRSRNVRVVWWAPRGDEFEIRLKDDVLGRWEPNPRPNALNHWVAIAKGPKVRGRQYSYEIEANDCVFDPRIIVSNDSLSLVELLAELDGALDSLSDAAIAELSESRATEIGQQMAALLTLLGQQESEGSVALAPSLVSLRTELDEALASLSAEQIADLPATRVPEIAEQMEVLLDLLDELASPKSA